MECSTIEVLPGHILLHIFREVIFVDEPGNEHNDVSAAEQLCVTSKAWNQLLTPLSTFLFTLDETIVFKAVWARRFDVLEQLLQDPKHLVEGVVWKDAINEAIECNYVDILRRFIEYDNTMLRPTGLSSNRAIDESLILASKLGHVGCVQALLEDHPNSDVHAGTESALRQACQFGHLPVVEMLRDHGADLHVMNGEALRVACVDAGRVDVVRYLLDNGLRVGENDDMDICSTVATQGNLEVLKLLIRFGGVDVHVRNDRMLRRACEHGNVRIVEFLLRFGNYAEESEEVIHEPANVHALDDICLRLASKNGHAGVVSVLLSKGANVHTDFDSALTFASRNIHFDVVRLLLQHGANPCFL